MSKAKRNALLFLSAAGILLLLLVMSLPTLILSPGQPFSLGKTEITLPGATGAIPGTDALIWMVRGMVALSVISFPIYIIYSLSSAKGRRRLVKNIVMLLILLWVAYYLREHPLREDPEEQALMTDASDDDNAEGTPVAIFSEDNAPPWLAGVIILAASAFSIGLLVAGVWFFRQRLARARHSLHPLADAAQDTIESLQAGGDFRMAIIRCYHEMNRVVKEERGLTREAAMTPHEFETYLASRGLPHDALETLTRLFERVRYGSVPSRTDDETNAFACLTEIVNACKAATMGYEKQ